MKKVAGGMAIVASLAGPEAYAGSAAEPSGREDDRAVAGRVHQPAVGEAGAFGAARPVFGPVFGPVFPAVAAEASRVEVRYAPVLPSIRATIGATPHTHRTDPGEGRAVVVIPPRHLAGR